MKCSSGLGDCNGGVTAIGIVACSKCKQVPGVQKEEHVKTNIVKLARQEKYEELSDYIDVKLSAMWMEILVMRKALGLDVEESEAFSVEKLFEFVVEMADAAGYDKETSIRHVSFLFEKLKEEAEEEAEAEDEDEQ